MHNWAKWLRSIRVVTAAVPLLGACAPYATPPASFSSKQVDQVPYDSVSAYASTLRFDTVLGAADVKRVAFDTLQHRTRIADAGDSAWIEPEVGAWNLDTMQLAAGRIIARIRTQHFHPWFGYGPRPTYWWVDKKGGSWRSLYFSDSLRHATQDALVLKHHAGYSWRQSLARWGSQWGTCSGSECCEGGPPQTQ